MPAVFIVLSGTDISPTGSFCCVIVFLLLWLSFEITGVFFCILLLLLLSIWLPGAL